jgi:hypothetical protein
MTTVTPSMPLTNAKRRRTRRRRLVYFRNIQQMLADSFYLLQSQRTNKAITTTASTNANFRMWTNWPNIDLHSLCESVDTYLSSIGASGKDLNTVADLHRLVFTYTKMTEEIAAACNFSGNRSADLFHLFLTNSHELSRRWNNPRFQMYTQNMANPFAQFLSQITPTFNMEEEEEEQSLIAV